MDRRPVTNQDVFETIVAWLAGNYPGERGERLLIKLHGRKRPVALPIPNSIGGADRPAAFEPTPFQLGILDALAGKALRVEAIVAAVKDRPKLYRDPGGIKELERQGLVKHDKSQGYYRPDAPPAEMEE